MVSNRDLMREVLMTQGEIFADRPDFKRYHLIFNGDRENCKLLLFSLFFFQLLSLSSSFSFSLSLSLSVTLC